MGEERGKSVTCSLGCDAGRVDSGPPRDSRRAPEVSRHVARHEPSAFAWYTEPVPFADLP